MTGNTDLLKRIADLGEARVAWHQALIKGLCAKHDDNEALLQRWCVAFEERRLRVPECYELLNRAKPDSTLNLEITERILQLDGAVAAIALSAQDCVNAHYDKDGALVFRRAENFEALCVRFEEMLDSYRRDYLT